MLIPPQTSLASFSFTAAPANPNVINQNRFIIEAKPKETVEEKIYVENTSEQEITLKIYGVDGQLNEENTFTAKTAAEEQQQVGTWAKVTNSEVTLKPKEKKIVKFKITIPENAALGDYHGGIAVENSPNGNGNENIKINTRVIVRVDLKVTETPNPPAKLHPEKSFWEKIDKNYLTAAVLLFTLSLLGLYFASLKEKRAKRAKPSRDD